MCVCGLGEGQAEIAQLSTKGGHVCAMTSLKHQRPCPPQEQSHQPEPAVA